MPATLWRWVNEGDGDLVITDVVMPDENAFDLLPRIKRIRPDLPIIVMSAQNTFMTAIRASEKGAYEYLPEALRPEGADLHRRPRPFGAAPRAASDTTRRRAATTSRWSAARPPCRTFIACSPA